MLAAVAVSACQKDKSLYVLTAHFEHAVTFVDSTGMSLVGENRKYHPDSVRRSSNLSLFREVDDPENIDSVYRFSCFYSGLHWIRYSATAADTFKVYSHMGAGGPYDCIVDSVVHRSKIIRPQENMMRVIVSDK